MKNRITPHSHSLLTFLFSFSLICLALVQQYGEMYHRVYLITTLKFSSTWASRVQPPFHDIYSTLPRTHTPLPPVDISLSAWHVNHLRLYLSRIYTPICSSYLHPTACFFFSFLFHSSVSFKMFYIIRDILLVCKHVDIEKIIRYKKILKFHPGWFINPHQLAIRTAFKAQADIKS